MPLHRIYAPASLFSAQDKREIAASITSFYTSVGLPAFYVIVLFIVVDTEDYFIGAESHSERHKRLGRPHVRIVSQHIAATMVGEEQRKRGTDNLGAKLNKWVADRGYEWELHIEEHPRDLWRIDGVVAPEHPSEGEKKWVEAKQAVPF